MLFRIIRISTYFLTLRLLIFGKQLVSKGTLLPVSDFKAERDQHKNRPGKPFEDGTHGRTPHWVASASKRAGQYCSPRR